MWWCISSIPKTASSTSWSSSGSGHPRCPSDRMEPVANERREAGERLLREANVLRIRKQYAEAEERCRAAVELLPDDVSALEMLGDLLYDKGSLEEARDHYQ